MLCKEDPKWFLYNSITPSALTSLVGVFCFNTPIRMKGETNMKQLKRSLRALSKDLKALTLRTQKMMKVLDKLEKGQKKMSVARKPVAKKVATKKAVTKRGKDLSATARVLKIIMTSKRGVNTSTIKNKTGYDNRKIWDIVHRAGKEGKIKKVDRGIYMKA
jgi:hypothetical protein